jgi:hypothetical protein
MICAANGCFELVMQTHYMNTQQRQWYMRWAKPFYDAVQGETTFLDADIFHLWHGDLGTRKYRARFDIVHGESGAWHWNTNKFEMHQYVLGWFASRREDG